VLPGHDGDHQKADDLVLTKELPLEVLREQAQAIIDGRGLRRSHGPRMGITIAAEVREPELSRLSCRAADVRISDNGLWGGEPSVPTPQPEGLRRWDEVYDTRGRRPRTERTL